MISSSPDIFIPKTKGNIAVAVALMVVVSLLMPLVAIDWIVSSSITQAAYAEIPRPSADFNNDGFADLAIGVPYEDVGTVVEAGAVNVIYGSSSKTATGNQFWHQDVTGIGDSPEVDDTYGWALATGDFNNDGFADLAIGIPHEDIGTVEGAGAVNVIYGSSQGLSATVAADGTGRANQFWHQEAPGINDVPESYDSFGISLASGDFNNDGKDDLAIGVRGESIGSISDGGAVNVLYGSSAGLSSVLLADGTGRSDQFWHQDFTGVADSAESGDRFGDVLATGDFNNDAFGDLAIGVPNEDVGTISGAGAVQVLYGSSFTNGLSTKDQFWHQDSPGIRDPAEPDDRFGHSLAVGDFGNENFDDLAIGVPLEDIGTINVAGAVNVIYGASGGLSSLDNQFWHQNSLGVIDDAESGDRFGGALATGHFDNNAMDDLAIGVPYETIGTADAGAVNVLYGTPSEVNNPGLTATGDQFWHQDRFGILDSVEAGDLFGNSLASGPLGS